jgi:multidrug efflux pump subunit AcrA (membrane-fusion protein)
LPAIATNRALRGEPETRGVITAKCCRQNNLHPLGAWWTQLVNLQSIPARRRGLSSRVTARDLIPSRTNWKLGDSVKHFIVRVRLDKRPAGVLPYMSAEVRLDTGRVVDALVIPVEVLTVVAGRQSCYVIGFNGLECRAITTRRATPDLLEVTSGLIEGERVVLRSLDVEKIPVEDRE